MNKYYYYIEVMNLCNVQQSEEIVFASVDAIALSEETNPTDDVVDNDNIWG